MALLELRNLCIDFTTHAGRVRAVDGVSLDIGAGETLALVGESGSGKSVTALAITRLIPSPPAVYAGGAILVEGRDTLAMRARQLCRVRGGVVSYVFQEPTASLNPAMRVGAQILEMLALHRPERATRSQVIELLTRVGIPAPADRIDDYPHQLSGGMQQRVMVAMAIASEPKLLVADEPTTALDVTIQAQVFDLLRALKRDTGLSILLITHNLGLVAELADRVAVMYAGQIVETGPAMAVLDAPRHPYTRALIASVPRLGSAARRLVGIPGNVPSPGDYPTGCRFHPRCSVALPACAQTAVGFEQAGPDHWARCPYALSTPPHESPRSAPPHG